MGEEFEQVCERSDEGELRGEIRPIEPESGDPQFEGRGDIVSPVIAHHEKRLGG